MKTIFQSVRIHQLQASRGGIDLKLYCSLLLVNNFSWLFVHHTRMWNFETWSKIQMPFLKELPLWKDKERKFYFEWRKTMVVASSRIFSNNVKLRNKEEMDADKSANSIIAMRMLRRKGKSRHVGIFISQRRYILISDNCLHFSSWLIYPFKGNLCMVGQMGHCCKKDFKSHKFSVINVFNKHADIIFSSCHYDDDEEEKPPFFLLAFKSLGKNTIFWLLNRNLELEMLMKKHCDEWLFFINQKLEFYHRR